MIEAENSLGMRPSRFLIPKNAVLKVHSQVDERMSLDLWICDIITRKNVKKILDSYLTL